MSPLFCNVNNGVFIVHIAEQWRYNAEEGEREGEGEELVESFLCIFARRVIVYYVVIQLQQKQREAASIDPTLQILCISWETEGSPLLLLSTISLMETVPDQLVAIHKAGLLN
ncbi:hypothetical protein NC651_018583 [Populus alba x Populus x berolinensis]|nr:hypothetical protein NC651_018583 [Populus alba x Populus x berolinensis]